MPKAKSQSNSTKNYRSAVNGRYVKPSYAQRNPNTTVRETSPKPRGKK